MFGLIKRYTRWLHTRWPAGTVEKLPLVKENGRTNVPGLYIVGDLTGIPLLKFSADSGAKAVRDIVADDAFRKLRENAKGTDSDDPVLDVVIVGAGVSGMAAALEARTHELTFRVLEAAQPFTTIVNFPKGKPIYTYPTGMEPTGGMHFRAEVKEPLLDELHEQTKDVEITTARVEKVARTGNLLEVVTAGDDPNLLARRVIVGIGRSGNFRTLGVPGEDLDKVTNRLHDPKDFCEQDVLVVGGGDSALETAIALAQGGARVTLSYRKDEFSRPKPENVEALDELAHDPNADVGVSEPSSERASTATGAWVRDSLRIDRQRAGQTAPAGSIRLAMASEVKEIRADEVDLSFTDKGTDDETLPNDHVFAMIGREAPLDFFRRSGVQIIGDVKSPRFWITFSAIFVFCIWLFHWKKYGSAVDRFFRERDWFPHFIGDWVNQAGGTFAAWANDPTTLVGSVVSASKDPGFYYSLLYCLLVVIFGIRRIRRRRTPYVKVQTWTLAAFQIIPLFLLPYFIFPWMGHNGWFAEGASLHWFGEEFFPDGSYWRSFGFILAWPLFVYNWFTAEPVWGWIILGFIQTFVIIPLLVYKWGKGAYCGWICSCGALAETLGDAHRHKMPHGPVWNRLNMIGQLFLLFAFVIMVVRVVGWILPGSSADQLFHVMLYGTWNGEKVPVMDWLNYAYFVDLLWAGIIGIALYFHFSGRVWCRFACPLAALMHIYARFSRFRILSEKKKCISCNVCTSVCHQGIDIMNFANKGVPMADPQCVRCSACVQSCPTGVLSFGEVNPKTNEVTRLDKLGASPVRMREGKTKDDFRDLGGDTTVGHISGGYTE